MFLHQQLSDTKVTAGFEEKTNSTEEPKGSDNYLTEKGGGYTGDGNRFREYDKTCIKILCKLIPQCYLNG